MHPKAAHLVEGFLRGADDVFAAGYSAVVYGSAAREDWLEGVSDINLLVLAAPLGPAELKALGPVLRNLPEEWRSPPLFLTPEEWSRAADVFAIELTDMLCARAVLRGADPLLAVQPYPTQLRVALERELRTRIVRLRQGYAISADDPAELGRQVRGSLAGVQTMARAALVLVGRPVPSEGVQLLRAFAEVTGAPVAALVEVGAHWRDPEWHCSSALFEGYFQSLGVAAGYIDQHVPGAR